MLNKSQITILTLNKKDIKNFAKERNELLKICKTPWVFFLDSDEVLDKKYFNNINNIIKKNDLDGILIKREDYFYNKKLKFGETRNTWLLRMAKTDKIKFVRPVHEVAKVQGRVGKSNIIIQHYAHESISSFLNKIIKYAELEAEFRASPSLASARDPSPASGEGLLLQIFTYPMSKFIFNFFIKLGFLDGWRGLIYATMMSFHSLMVRIFLYEKTK